MSRAWAASCRSTFGSVRCVCATRMESGSRSRMPTSTLRPAALLRGTVEVAEVGAGRCAHRLPVEQERPDRSACLDPRAAAIPASRGNPKRSHRCAGAGPAGSRRGRDLRADRPWWHRLRWGRCRLDLALRRTDRSTAQARPVDRCRSGGANPASGCPWRGDGRPFATATGHPDAGALRLSLTGDGPLADWKGRLELNV